MSFNPKFRTTEYGSIHADVLNDIRSFDAAELCCELGSNNAGSKNRMRCQLAWLKTDPEIGEKVVASLATCPFNSVPGGGRIAELVRRIKELEAAAEASAKA